MSQQIVLTPEGVKKLEEELQYLKKEKRAEVSKRIELAKEFGDLSENAEYHEAKEEQAFVEGRIVEIESMLKVATVAEAANSTSEVRVGSTVILNNGKVDVTYSIVGATEADPLSGKISLDSPLGEALLGKKPGETVEYKTPNGVMSFTVVSIE